MAHPACTHIIRHKWGTSVPGSDEHRTTGMTRKGSKLRPVLPAKCPPEAKGFHRPMKQSRQQGPPLFHSGVPVRLMHRQSFESRSEILKHMHFRLIQTRFPQLTAPARGNHSYQNGCVHSGSASDLSIFLFPPSKCFMWKAQVFCFYFFLYFSGNKFHLW